MNVMILLIMLLISQNIKKILKEIKIFHFIQLNCTFTFTFSFPSMLLKERVYIIEAGGVTVTYEKPSTPSIYAKSSRTRILHHTSSQLHSETESSELFKFLIFYI